MKLVLYVLLLFVLAKPNFAQEALKIPDGVVYKEATAEVNEKAKALLLKTFSPEGDDENILSLFENNLICGPGLWQKIKSDDAVSRIEKGIAIFRVPVLAPDGSVNRIDNLQGKHFQSPDDILAFWKTFKERTDLTDLKIRKLNEKEIEIFWAMIPFDIQEPLFILESENHKVLVAFTDPEDLKIMWIDDYQELWIDKTESSENPDKTKDK